MIQILHYLPLFRVKNANFFAKNCENISKIITSVPDCASRVIYEYIGFLDNFRGGPYFGQLFPTEKSYVLILTKNGLGYISGNLLTDSSGHPNRWQRPEHGSSNKTLFRNLQSPV
jgi:hypothetical protein